MLIALRWFHYILILALAGFLITLAVSDRTAERFMLWFGGLLEGQGGRMAIAGIAVFVLAAQAFMLVRWFTLRRYAREIGYQNDLGKVSVSLVAIEEALTRAIEGEAGVRRVAIRVYEDRVKRCVIIEPILTLWEDVNVTAINHRCQELLRARFGELMPERDQVQVNLTLHRLNQRQAAVETSPESPAVQALSQSTAKDMSGGDVPAHDPASAIAAVSAVVAEAGASNAPSVIYAEDQLENNDGDVEQLDLPSEAAMSEMSAAERIRSERMAAVKAVSQRRRSEVNDEEDLDYDSLYAGPTYPVDYGDADEDDEDSKRS